MQKLVLSWFDHLSEKDIYKTFEAKSAASARKELESLEKDRDHNFGFTFQNFKFDKYSECFYIYTLKEWFEENRISNIELL